MKTRILLVDADKNELVNLIDALKDVPHEDGFKCTYASNGPTAVNMLSFYFAPDIIILDAGMPVREGIRIVEKVKKNPALHHTRTYLYADKPDAVTRRIADKLDAAGFIEKNSRRATLTDQIRAAFSFL